MMHILAKSKISSPHLLRIMSSSVEPRLSRFFCQDKAAIELESRRVDPLGWVLHFSDYLSDAEVKEE